MKKTVKAWVGKRIFRLGEGILRGDKKYDHIGLFPVTFYLMKHGRFQPLNPKYFDKDVILFARLKRGKR